METIPAKDGVLISYTSEGRGEPAIVLIHGWTCDHAHWRYQIPEFSKSFQVVAIDLPGHGVSGGSRESWSIGGLAEDVATVVHGLGLRRVLLVGHSMGGSVALATASKLRGIVRGVIAVDSLHNVEFSYPADTVDQIVRKFEDDFDGARKRFLSSFFEDSDNAVLRCILDRPILANRKAAIALLRDHNRFDAKSALEVAGVPVRAINAADGPDTAVEINRKHGDFEAVLIPDVGHFLMLEKPVEFNRNLRDVIDRLRKE